MDGRLKEREESVKKSKVIFQRNTERIIKA
jgi:hypothetical protein